MLSFQTGDIPERRTGVKVITIEDHFATPRYQDLIPPATGWRARNLADQDQRVGYNIAEELQDLGESRLRAMDEAGIDLQVISFTSPGCQNYEADIAVPMAREANERLCQAIAAHPDRFAGFAALPTAHAAESVRELERCVTRLGFKGAMINGHTRGRYLDDREYWGLFECAQALDVPVYLHPTLPNPAAMKAYFEGYEELARAAWGFAVETSIHFLRLVLAGVFDAFPRLTLVLGHLGEGIPFALDRLNQHTYLTLRHRGLKKNIAEYLRDHVYVTTSGNFSVPAFMCTVMTLGIDRVIFSIDWPYESNRMGMDFFRKLPLGEDDLAKVAHRNAERLLKL